MILKRIFLCLLCIAFLVACQDEKKTENSSDTLTDENMDVITIRKKHGCDATNASCIDMEIKFPALKDMDDASKEEIHHIMTDYISDFLVADKPIKTNDFASYVSETIDAIVDNSDESTSISKLKFHSDFRTIFRNSQLICLQNTYESIKASETINGEGYFIIDLQANELLYVDDIILNFGELESQLLQKVKEQNNVPLTTDIKDLGFLIEDQDFAITDNIGISDGKIFFTYLPQEIAPNSSGLFRFMLEKEDIKDDLNQSFVKKWESQQ